ncbi:hypothetical protein TASI_1184 [Taylorella asinigenitalis MCE3]|uniref:Uncharacterized protein n=1 Tax=Taylorella asinigenitalis (strain MCE3) TaxID=1008459 RepID=G4QBF8_TAYAM|nr:hypothetical protein TASI_1184 [Taylorella asinigenitalis MCE3]
MDPCDKPKIQKSPPSQVGLIICKKLFAVLAYALIQRVTI